jgi:hypothetical protein
VSLRAALTADLPLKLTSVGLSVFLWFLAAGEEPASALVPVDVTVRPPAGRTVVHAAGPVHALVSGPRHELPKLTAAPMRLTRVLPDTTSADQVQLEVGPGDLELPRGSVEETLTLDTSGFGRVRVVPGRVGLRVLAPAGLEATALPDGVTLVRRSADG